MNTTASPIEIACRISDLADYLDVDQADTILGFTAMQATAQAVEFLECDLVARDRVTTYQHWPYSGTATHPSLSRQDARLIHDIELPYANLEPESQVTVTVYGETVTEFETLATKPAKVRLYPSYGTDDQPAIVLAYRSGFGESVEDVPSEIQYGVLTLAAFLFEHRGHCEADEAMRRSGAAGMLGPYRLRAVRL